MTKDDLIKYLNSIGPTLGPIESAPEPTPALTIVITPSKLIELVNTLDRHSTNIEHLTDTLTKQGKILGVIRSILSVKSGNKTDMVGYDNVVREMMAVSNQINLQYNLMVTSILEVLEGNG